MSTVVLWSTISFGFYLFRAYRLSRKLSIDGPLELGLDLRRHTLYLKIILTR